MHRLVQSVILDSLSSKSQAMRFEDAVIMVQDKFPPMISKTFHYRSNDAWKTCEKYLPHALSLDRNFDLLRTDLSKLGLLKFRQLLGDVIM